MNQNLLYILLAVSILLAFTLILLLYLNSAFYFKVVLIKFLFFIAGLTVHDL